MSGANSRRSLRLPIETRVFIELEAPAPGSAGPGNVASCESLEVSETGLRARLGESVSVGAILQIGVELPGKEEPFYLVAQARWRKKDESNPDCWIAGFEILNAQGSDISQWRAALQILEERPPES